MPHYQNIDIGLWPHRHDARKKNIPVSVRFACQDGIMHTLEGDVAYTRGDALLFGAHDDCWPVDAAYFMRSYNPASGTQAGQDGLYYKNDVIVVAAQMTEPFSINTMDGSLLHGEAGDWLVQYEHGHYGIVRDAIFAETYELL